jgi:hypothetical protein
VVDARGGEEGRGPAEEGRAGGGLLVRVDLVVGQAAVVVDGGVNVVEAHVAAPGAAGLAAQDLVAAAVRDPAELLDVHVDQVAGPLTLIAADDLPGGPVQEGQTVQAVPGQDPVNGRGGQAQDRPKAGGAKFARLPQSAHPGLHRRRSAVRCRQETAGAVVQSLFALRPPAADPLVARGAGDAHLGRDMCDGATCADTFDQQPPAMNGQPGITVGHEDLRAVKTQHLHHTGGLRRDQARPVRAWRRGSAEVDLPDDVLGDGERRGCRR